VQDPLNRIYEYFPDAAGRIVNVKDALGRFTHTEYDDLDRVATLTDPQGKSQHWSYDGNSNVLSFTDAKNQTTIFTYDPLNRLKTKQDALLKQESYDYDFNGNLLFVTDRKGQVTGYGYDALDRLSQTGYGAATTTAPAYTDTIDYQYDVVGRLTQIQDSANGTISRTYDDRFDALQQEVSAQGTVDYTYDAAGRRQTMTPSGGTTVSYDYDNAYRLTGIEQAAGTGGGALPAIQQSVSISYDSAGRPTVLTLPNGMTMSYGYDNASQLTGITYKKADDTLIGDLAYSYNAIGNRIATGGTLARTSLPEAVADSQHDANNKLTERDTVAYTYDDNGNLISDGSRTYTWNARDQLTAISDADTASFEYDGLGRRRTATVNGQTTSTLYDGWNPIQRQAGGAVLENRLYGLSLDNILARTQSSVTESYLTDALGSALELRDAAQNPTVQYTYDPYGNTTSSAASTNTIKYTGREQDASDLYYYRHRYYKPSVGRFISEDPIGLAGGSNFYAYVNGNPVNYTDPTGLITGGDDAAITVFCIANPWACGAGAAAAAMIYCQNNPACRDALQGCFDSIGRMLNEAPAREYDIPVAGNPDADSVGAPVSVDDAVDIIKSGGNVIAKDKDTAKDIATKAGGGAPPVHDKGHRGGKDHYHPNGRTGGHVFY
jgi:RHS repeat-associated protein